MRIGFIGSGNMVGAIASGAVQSGTVSGEDVWLTDRSGKSAPALAKRIGAHAAKSNSELAKTCDLIVLGVKPAGITAVADEIAKSLTSEKTVISLAAGIKTSTIEDHVGNVPVVRVMPNVNAQIGQSMTGIAAGKHAGDEQVAKAEELMGAVGKTMVVEENQFAAFAALAGCSPCWLYAIVDALARAGVKHGLGKDAATRIVAQAMLGSAALVQAELQEGQIPANLMDRVSSPGGTTIAGLLAAQEAGLAPALVKAVDAAVKRDNELG
ncbi:pyrroline-5-carboxylate reductase [Gleimia hominis]|uniref:pyrroline-5-carboxylate reductase n=1 Tax=Gleimia hominis TaxID=595468 RepID=UPI000C80001B|nr:pyrroline-5-carboxylate reductase [Gleimia hominis]WIK64887.1 pyrroline-5-carboxylate reductase [Gleimia hominis]